MSLVGWMVHSMDFASSKWGLRPVCEQESRMICFKCILESGSSFFQPKYELFLNLIKPWLFDNMNSSPKVRICKHALSWKSNQALLLRPLTNFSMSWKKPGSHWVWAYPRYVSCECYMFTVPYMPVKISRMWAGRTHFTNTKYLLFTSIIRFNLFHLSVFCMNQCPVFVWIIIRCVNGSA